MSFTAEPSMKLARKILGGLTRADVPRNLLQRLYLARRGGTINQDRAFDLENGITTGGLLLPWLLYSGSPRDRDNLGYAGCHPGCLRAALAQIDRHERYTFVDLGAGKGRSLAVASEHAFRHILGIELSPDLYKIARSNLAALRRKFPARQAVELVNADVLDLEFKDENIVFFFYHSFGEELLRTFAESMLRDRTSGEIYFVYQNPVNGHVLDAMEPFHRWHAEMVPSGDAESTDAAAQTAEAVVTWRWSAGPAQAARPGADARIIAGATHARLQSPDTGAEPRREAPRF
jgi:SAM-dependent methyltransferase